MKKPIKPIVNENLFILFISIFFTFGFISIFKFEYSWAVGFVFYCGFSEFYSRNFFDFLKPFLYTSVSKYKSKLFKGNYYEYITANCERVSFHKNKLHSEHDYSFDMKYYLNGFYLNSLSKDPYLHSDCSEYMLSCKNYIEENEFHLAIWEKDYNKVKKYLKEKKITLHHSHYLFGMKSSDKFIEIFEPYINNDIYSKIFTLLNLSLSWKAHTYFDYFFDIYIKNINNEENLKELSLMLPAFGLYSKNEAVITSLNIINKFKFKISPKQIYDIFMNTYERSNLQVLARVIRHYEDFEKIIQLGKLKHREKAKIKYILKECSNINNLINKVYNF